jgi:hypothetical protein
MALAADRLIEYREDELQPFPVATGAVIYAGALVCLNAAGYLVPAADTATLKFVGVAIEAKDNTAGQNGDLKCLVRREGVFRFKATSIAQASAGDIMYAKDDETFDESSDNGIRVGRLVEIISATEGWIDIETAVTTPADPEAADDFTVGDPGNFFAAAKGTVKGQIQDLAQGPFFLTIKTLAAWTKDGAAHAALIPKVEFPFPVRIKRNYSGLETAPGADKTLSVLIGAVEIASIAGTDVQGENEALDIAVAKDTDLDLKLNETAAGAGAGLQCVLVYYKDDGE